MLRKRRPLIKGHPRIPCIDHRYREAFCRHQPTADDGWICGNVGESATYVCTHPACDDVKGYTIYDECDKFCRAIRNHENCPNSPYTLIYIGLVRVKGYHYYYMAVHADELEGNHTLTQSNYWNPMELGKTPCLEANLYIARVGLEWDEEEGAWNLIDNGIHIVEYDSNINSSKTDVENTDYIIQRVLEFHSQNP